MFWQLGLLSALHQGHKRFLQNILSLAMAQAQGPPIKDKVRRFGFVKGFAPPAWLVLIHNVTG